MPPGWRLLTVRHSASLRFFRTVIATHRPPLRQPKGQSNVCMNLRCQRRMLRQTLQNLKPIPANHLAIINEAALTTLNHPRLHAPVQEFRLPHHTHSAGKIKLRLPRPSQLVLNHPQLDTRPAPKLRPLPQIRSNRSVQLQRPPASTRLRIPKSLIATHLIQEHNTRRTPLQRPRQSAQTTRQQLALRKRRRLSQGSLALLRRNQRRRGVHNNQIDSFTARQLLQNPKRLLPILSPSQQQRIQVHTHLGRIPRIKRTFDINERRRLPIPLYRRHRLQSQSRLPHPRWPKQLDNPAPRQPAHTQRRIHCDRPARQNPLQVAPPQTKANRLLQLGGIPAIKPGFLPIFGNQRKRQLGGGHNALSVP